MYIELSCIGRDEIHGIETVRCEILLGIMPQILDMNFERDSGVFVAVERVPVPLLVYVKFVLESLDRVKISRIDGKQTQMMERVNSI